MAAKPITENTLFYGDNLFILREYLQNESVDLIYLDPPFDSNRNYNVLFKDEHGMESEAQLEAFEDTWHWNLEAEHTYEEMLTEAPYHVADMIVSMPTKNWLIPRFGESLVKFIVLSFNSALG
jgi:site-specific DNA-methyltransferase (adenine-specific)